MIIIMDKQWSGFHLSRGALIKSEWDRDWEMLPSLSLILVICWREKKETEWSARKLIWTGISYVQSPLASLMEPIIPWGGKSRKDLPHLFSLTNSCLLSLYFFNPHSSIHHFSTCSFPLPLHTSLYLSQAEELWYYLTSQRDKLKCVALSLGLSNLLTD